MWKSNDSDDDRPCAESGLIIEGSAAGCRAFFDDPLAGEIGEVLDSRSHRMAVATHALQHPERFFSSMEDLRGPHSFCTTV